MKTDLRSKRRKLSKEKSVDITEILPEPPTKRCKRKLINPVQPVDPVDFDPEVEVQSKQLPTKRRKRKLINPADLDSKADCCTTESVDGNFDGKSGNVHSELIVRFHRLITEVLDGSVLSDDHMSAGSQLLHSQFPNFQGFSSPVLGQRFCFPYFNQVLGYAGHSYLQILHTGSHHWVAVEIVSSSEVYIYDSLYKQRPTFYTLKQVAAILNTSEPKVDLRFCKVQFQPNSEDCGVYALAFVTDLSHGIDPSSRKYSRSKVLRKHLAQCFESGHMKPFPSTPSVKEAPWTQVMNIYCCCRMPYGPEHSKSNSVPVGEVTEMIQCNICLAWYHHNCVNLTIEEVKKFKRTSEFWMCDYNGCNDAFADIFDTDSD